MTVKCPRCDFPNAEDRIECFICSCNLKEGEVANMLNLPRLDYKDWTAAQQLRKIGEEFGEVAEAVAQDNPVRIVKESLDAIQTLDTLITIVVKEYNLDLVKFYKEHREKLRVKGYLLGEGDYYDEYKD